MFSFGAIVIAHRVGKLVAVPPELLGTFTVGRTDAEGRFFLLWAGLTHGGVRENLEFCNGNLMEMNFDRIRQGRGDLVGSRQRDWYVSTGSRR